VDARGRVAWTHKGDEQTSLLVIVSRSTPLPYLARLRQERIPYLLAGAHRVDLAFALAKIRAQLGAQCLVVMRRAGVLEPATAPRRMNDLHGRRPEVVLTVRTYGHASPAYGRA
jgi:hypothetical protein